MICFQQLFYGTAAGLSFAWALNVKKIFSKSVLTANFCLSTFSQLWDSYKKGYKAWLQLEKSLSDHSVSAYLSDLEKLTQFFQSAELKISPKDVTLKHLQKFTAFLNELGMTATSQARIISGIRSFFDYCVAENVVENDPTLLLEAPKTRRKLPDTLSVDEVELIISSIDLSTPEGIRNKAIFETM